MVGNEYVGTGTREPTVLTSQILKAGKVSAQERILESRSIAEPIFVPHEHMQLWKKRYYVIYILLDVTVPNILVRLDGLSFAEDHFLRDEGLPVEAADNISNIISSHVYGIALIRLTKVIVMLRTLVTHVWRHRS